MKVNKYVLIALVLTIVVCGYVFFFTGKKPVTGSVPVATTTVGQGLTEVKKPGAGGTTPAVLDAAWERDPFELPKAFEGSPTGSSDVPARLVAILSGRNGRVALIGSEVVKKGDMIFGERVQEIGVDRVTLTRGDLKRYLTLDNKGRAEAMKNTNIEVGK